jgi:hypothetical protein
VQQQARTAYPDLYTDGDGNSRLQIADGTISCRCLHQTLGLGTSIWPELETLTPVSDFDVTTV